MSKGTDFNRVQLDKGVTNRLRNLKADTKLSRNYLCRIGLCYSLREPRPPSPGEYDANGQEFNRYLLLGDHDPLYIALVQERLISEDKDPENDFYEEFVAHINRGVEQISGRVRDLTDLYEMMPGELKKEETD
ncbi:DNA sulfur modification protein DndE [Haladaptatus sp. W1]|uniref:DNA sulfur modification protein DndE n=1 Tax=Haladaptatus sp. W1 TaxID=1897478 RepID=UPI0009F45EAD|nr:DNA sulfur modification protein DndE [Haladaptatus sp. W1]